MEVVPSVLLVAATPVNLERVGMELAVAGLRSHTVNSSDEAVARASARAFDVAIISADQTASGGAALVQQLKAICPTMACIVVTSQPSREEALQSLTAGALAYVSGPPDAQSLASLVKERRRHTLSATEDALQVRVEEQEGVPLLSLSGDLDIVTAPLLQRRINELLNAGHDRLLLDAHSLGFCDSTGLRVLLGARRRLNERSGDLCLLRASNVLKRLLDLSGLDSRLLPAGATRVSG